MNAQETYAELERVRRDIATTRHRLETLDDQDRRPGAKARLQAFEDEERDLLQQLADTPEGSLAG
jgi:hypothetical protein